MNIQIEKLKTSDLQGYKDLIDKAFDGSNEIATYKNGYNEQSDKYEIIVAKTENGQVVGSLTFYKLDLFTFSFQPSLEIFNVCVLDEYRGQKIGKKLFEYTLKYAKENNYKSMHLTCLDTARDAHRLYESMGMNKTNSVKYFIKL